MRKDIYEYLPKEYIFEGEKKNNNIVLKSQCRGVIKPVAFLTCAGFLPLGFSLHEGFDAPVLICAQCPFSLQGGAMARRGVLGDDPYAPYIT